VRRNSRLRLTDEIAGPQRLPAGVVEGIVIGEIRKLIRAPEITARTIRDVQAELPKLRETEIIEALKEFDKLWAALYPAEQTRIIHLLVQRVTVGEDGVAVDLRHEGLGAVLQDLLSTRKEETCT